MTEQLQLQRHHRVLEIGTGSGYQAAILSRLCRQVLTIERYRTLADSARARLEKLACDNVEVMLGDGFDVAAIPGGDFDRIIVTAAMEQIPDALLQRLEPGGILIAPVGPHQGTQTLIRIAGPRRDLRARNWWTCVSCRRCRASPASCKTRIGCPANILFAGLSRCLLGTCLLKTVICCV